MKLQKKLVIVLTLCGVVPMAASVAVTYHRSARGLEHLDAEAVVAIKARAKDQLTSTVASRAAHVGLYLDTIRDHALSMVQDSSIVDAMAALGTAFPQIATENAYDDAKLQQARTEVGGFYRDTFRREYQRQMGGKDAPVDRVIGKLDAATLVAQQIYIQHNPNPIGQKSNFARGEDTSSYTQVHARVHPSLKAFQERFGYYDVFLIAPDGRVVYTVFKEVDFATSLDTGPWSSSNLGDLYRRLRGVGDDQFAFVDFANYLPSYDAPASFLGAPIVKDGQRIGYLAFQMPIDRLNSIMAKRDGLGETGEVVLVGDDYLMRSDSRHEPETHSVIASFRNPATGKLDIVPVRSAIVDGKPGCDVIKDDDGGEELSAWTPLAVFGERWAVVAKIETKEVFASAAAMEAAANATLSGIVTWSLGVVLGVGTLLAGIAWWFARQLVKPINGSVIALKDIAEGEGDLTRRLDEERKDELGEMGLWFNRFLGKLQGTVRDIASKAHGVSASANQLLGNAEQLTQGAERTMAQSSTVASGAEEMSANMGQVGNASEQMASTLRAVAAAVEQMTASIAEVAKSAEGAAQVAGQAVTLTSESNERMSSLGAAADEIGRVIETIQDIAEQTNLLALNATIEAARAGEAGKGFSVVANEVKDLARQTAEATQDIRQRIERIQGSASQSVKSIGEIDKVIQQVSAASRSIATAVGEQRSATQEIAQSLANNTRTVEVVNRNVEESVTASRDISKSISAVDTNARRTAETAAGTQQAGRALASLATELQAIVAQFRV